jgi:branched-subunit amino acid aminotransferase/4-amino-4-deoxychorismate lyase
MAAQSRGACPFAPRRHEWVGMGDLEETMRFDPDDGIANLDQHLDRLKTAAESRGFKFDRHAARNELQAATFGKRGEAIARLLLSPTGAMAIELRVE